MVTDNQVIFKSDQNRYSLTNLYFVVLPFLKSELRGSKMHS